MTKKVIGKARIHLLKGLKYRVVWKGREMTLKELRAEIDKMIAEEDKTQSEAQAGG